MVTSPKLSHGWCVFFRRKNYFPDVNKNNSDLIIQLHWVRRLTGDQFQPKFLVRKFWLSFWRVIYKCAEGVIARSSRPELFWTKGFLKNFAKFKGKHLCWSLFLIKLQAIRPPTLFKRDSNTGAFLWNLQIFKNTYFKEHLRRLILMFY